MVEEKYLIMVDAACNRNKFYHMIPKDSNHFEVLYGRVGENTRSACYEMNKWDTIYNQKIRKGYEDKSLLYLSASDSICLNTDFEDVIEKSVQNLIKNLINQSRQIIKDNYSVNTKAVTKFMIEEAENILVEMSNTLDLYRFNTLLNSLFHVIERKMKNVTDYLARTQNEMSVVLNREYSLLQNLKSHVVSDITSDFRDGYGKKLSDHGLKINECNKTECKEMIKRLDPVSAQKFSMMWKVEDIKHDENFKKYLKDNNINITKYAFHGSGTENWWSILCNGLQLNPMNAVITGKMFGYGIYTAPKANKAAGYTSLYSAAWKNGNSDTGYIAVYEVAYGKPADVYKHENWHMHLKENEFMKKFPGCNCLHAHAGNSLRNDEVIVYNENALRIKYIIELKD